MTTRSSCLVLFALAVSACSAIFEYPEIEPERGADLCQDGQDTDFDGQIDCEDPDCDGFCPEESEPACNDSRDNDGDGLTDASDPRCWRQSPPRAERCAETSGEHLLENFDLPSWNRADSFWQRWGVGSVGQYRERLWALYT